METKRGPATKKSRGLRKNARMQVTLAPEIDDQVNEIMAANFISKSAAIAMLVLEALKARGKQNVLE